MNPRVIAAMADPGQRRLIADRLGQADVIIQFGLAASDGQRTVFLPSPDGSFRTDLEAGPAKGQSRETTFVTQRYAGRPVWGQYVVEITLANPYTYRETAIANVTGLLAAITLFALGLVGRRLGGAGPTVHDAAPPAHRCLPGARRGRPGPARADVSPAHRLVGDRRARGPVQRDGRPARGERRDHPPRPRPQPRLPGRRVARAPDAAGRAAHVQPAPDGGRRRRPGRAGGVPRVERGPDRAPGLARPEPARALQARFGPRAARPATGRPAGRRRIGDASARCAGQRVAGSP